MCPEQVLRVREAPPLPRGAAGDPAEWRRRRRRAHGGRRDVLRAARSPHQPAAPAAHR